MLHSGFSVFVFELKAPPLEHSPRFLAASYETHSLLVWVSFAEPQTRKHMSLVGGRQACADTSTALEHVSAPFIIPDGSLRGQRVFKEDGRSLQSLRQTTMFYVLS